MRQWIGQRVRRNRVLRMYRPLIGSGALCFDIGAHVGERVQVFRRLGARVVAVEPQPAILEQLRVRWDSDPYVFIEASAVAATVGHARLRLNRSHSTLASLDPQWQMEGRFASTEWGDGVVVPTTTLAHLIENHGRPDFCKIDVEGAELEVLKGLDRPLPLLSFEFSAPFLERVRECTDRLRQLGPIETNLSLGEAGNLELPRWAPAEVVLDHIYRSTDADLWGDVYVRSISSI